MNEESQATFQQRMLGRFNSLLLPRALALFNYRICHYDRSVDPARPEYNEHVIYGEGINIAARLEALAPSGAIMISDIHERRLNEAAEKLPTTRSQDPASFRALSSATMLGPPVAASGNSMISAPASRHGRMLEWCS